MFFSIQITKKTNMLITNIILIIILVLATLNFCTIIATGYNPSESVCSNDDFTANSTYEDSLRNLLTSLESNAAKDKDYVYLTIDNRVNGMFLCRGDMNSTGNDSCEGCVTEATKHTPPDDCPMDRSATIWYDKCIVRYSDVSFKGILVLDQTMFKFWKSQYKISAYTKNVDKFNLLVSNTVQDLADDQSGLESQSGDMSGRKYYSTNVTNFETGLKLYTMVQCTPDLVPSDCGKCISSIYDEFIQYCSGSAGCRMMNPSCWLRYEIYKFYGDVVYPPPPAQLSAVPPSMALSPSPPSKKLKSQSHAVSVGVGILVVLLVVLVTVLIYLRCRKKSEHDNNIGNIEISKRALSNASTFNTGEEAFVTFDYLQYELATIEAATNNFSHENKLGEGGFGSVFKGILNDGREIAVKRLDSHSSQGKEEFKAEVEFVAKLQHRNLVRLLGYYIDAEERLLVYEFVPNRSLDTILFDPEMREKLKWSTRHKIINGIARGILYLHEDSRLKIIHRDLKASNVLLDADMNPKISDFGLARNIELNQERGLTHKPAGTLGYMAPEYMEYGEFSTKSDVFSFGVLVLEIISGKKVIDKELPGQSLLIHAWEFYNRGAPLQFMDDSIRDSFSSNEVTRCIQLGLLCVQTNKEDRPTMLWIVSCLNSNLTLPAPSKPVASIYGSSKGSRSTTKELVSEKYSKSSSRSRTTSGHLQSDKSTSK